MTKIPDKTSWLFPILVTLGMLAFTIVVFVLSVARLRTP
jgi:hypothetical protein